MKRCCQVLILILALCVFQSSALAQCSICTKTAQQLGEGPAKGLNAGIIYLAGMPLLIIGYVGYKWWKHNR